mmetsp:Transcript_79244/g.210441  ORF Transcript_79244/g.210441 Transcript_79244/m.210441 type:complete len:224 (-) Transcript_79244:193-864(-)
MQQGVIIMTRTSFMSGSVSQPKATRERNSSCGDKANMSITMTNFMAVTTPNQLSICMAYPALSSFFQTVLNSCIILLVSGALTIDVFDNKALAGAVLPGAPASAGLAASASSSASATGAAGMLIQGASIFSARWRPVSPISLSWISRASNNLYSTNTPKVVSIMISIQYHWQGSVSSEPPRPDCQLPRTPATRRLAMCIQKAPPKFLEESKQKRTTPRPLLSW